MGKLETKIDGVILDDPLCDEPPMTKEQRERAIGHYNERLSKRFGVTVWQTRIHESDREELERDSRPFFLRLLSGAVEIK